VLFVTAAAVTAQDTNGVADVYLRGTCVNDPCTPATWRISVALDGTQGNGRSIAPYVCNEPWGPTEIFSFASEATNLLPAGVVTLPFVGGVFVRVSAVD
jgi:hypothetical protein